MDERTLIALKMSIQHWEANVAAESPDQPNISGDVCPLCTLFYDSPIDDYCVGCPVSKKTGMSSCSGTPWYEVWKALGNWQYYKNDETKKQYKKRAEQELDFLKSLLPS
jgi:hypothetical protein